MLEKFLIDIFFHKFKKRNKKISLLDISALFLIIKK